jgi:hypothetical protein
MTIEILFYDTTKGRDWLDEPPAIVMHTKDQSVAAVIETMENTVFGYGSVYAVFISVDGQRLYQIVGGSDLHKVVEV